MAEDKPEGFPPDWTAEDVVEYLREVLRHLREHGAELRAKGLDVDGMAAELERRIEELERGIARQRLLEGSLRLSEEESAQQRRAFDALVLAYLPPDLVDGAGTVEYLKGKAEERAFRRKGPRGRVGG